MATRTSNTRTRSSVITARAAATFDPVGRSVATARAFVRDTLQGWGFADIVDDAVVLTSELVTNAVVHAGTAADVLCLRTEDGVRVEVADRYPEREIPLQSPGRPFGDPDRESGRGLLLCAALASRWGVEYTPTHKHVWFQLDLPDRPVGTRSAGPRRSPTGCCPLADERVRVAVVQIDRAGAIAAWNDDAAHLFGHTAEQVIGKPAHRPRRLAADPRHRHRHRRGPAAVPLGGQLRHPRRRRPRHPRLRLPPAGPRRPRRTVHRLPARPRRRARRAPDPGPRAPPPTAASRPSRATPTPSRSSSAPPPPTTSTACSSAPSNAPATCSTRDAAFLLLATDDETELEVRATTGLPSARQRFARVPVEAGTGRYGSARMPAVHEDLTAVPGAVPAAGRHRHALRRHRPAQGRGPAHRLPRRRRRGAGPLLQRGGPAPPVRRRPHRAGRRVAPASASWNGCAAARCPSSSRPPTCWPAPSTGTRPWR